MISAVVEHRSERDVSATSGRGWVVLRFVVATIILTAAGLKAHQLATVPSLGEGLFHARWFNILVVEFELFFGIWLLFGLLPKLTWLATFACFSVFALVSLYKALSGEASCGCFGMATVNPWLTTVFDLVIIGVLFRFRPVDVILHWRDVLKIEKARLSKNRMSIMAVAVLWLLVAIPVTYSIMSLDTVILEQNQEDLAGKSVTLEPMNWIGKPFPLNDLLDTDVLPKDWGVDKWTVLLHNGNCLVCESLLHELAEKADSVNFDRLAVIEVPGGMAVELPAIVRKSSGLVCSLRRSSAWFVPSPIALTIENGNVTRVQIGTSARDMFFTKR